MLRTIFRRRRRDAELNEEIEAHLRMAIRDRIERGEPPEEAQFAVLREFGNAGLVKETTRAVWTWTAVEQMLQDLRAALRILTRSRSFSAAAIALIALGIGGNTTIYSMIHGLLTKPAPGVNGDRLVMLEQTMDGHLDDPSNSYPNYLDYAAQSRTVRPLMARGFERFTLTLRDGSYAFRGAPVTGNYFETLGVHLIKGRAFTAEEALRGSSGLAAVISYGIWRDLFQSAADIVGRSIVLNGHPATIVGVAPPRFRGTVVAEHLDIWVPLLNWVRLNGTEADLSNRAVRTVEIMGRLAPGASLSTARAEFETISKRLQAGWPAANKGKMVLLEPYTAAAFGSIQRGRVFLAILAAVALVVLLVMCANVANLMLARAVARQREMAVRRSIGAPRGRILRMLLAEALVLSLAAWIASVLFAEWASRALVKLVPTNSSGVRLEPDLTPDWHVIGYALLLAVMSALAFTVAPALRAWRQELLPWLKAGEQGLSQGRSRVSSVLVVAQLACCVVLLTSAGLAYRSLYLIDNIDLRFNKDHLLVVTVNTAAAAVSSEENLQVLEQLRQRLRTARGITSASYARTPLPFSWSEEPARTAGIREPVTAYENFVGPDYFRALGMTPVQGREFTERDRGRAHPVAVVNQNLGDALWPGQPATGQSMLLGAGARPVEVIGVVPNGFFGSFRQDNHPSYVFLSDAQRPTEPGEATFYVRYSGSLDRAGPAVRAAIHAIDPRIPVVYMRSMETQLESITGPVLVITTLLSFFALGCLFLAGIGLYAVVSFNMSRRTRDFGIRMALGASPEQILASVLREGLLLTGVGLAFGLALSLAAGRAFRSVLVGVSPTDGPTYAGVLTVLATVSLVACCLPARRASRVDPVRALRQE